MRKTKVNALPPSAYHRNSSLKTEHADEPKDDTDFDLILVYSTDTEKPALGGWPLIIDLAMLLER